MLRLSLVATTIAASSLLALSGGCARDAQRTRASAAPAIPAEINHVVFFGLKNPADAPALVDDCRERLSQIPGVISLFCGMHVDAGRPSIQTDYDVCLYVGFPTLDDYETYVSHPLHVALVADWRDRFAWYRVYDVRDETFRAGD